MKNVVKCPYCKCQYLLGEIFTPNNFLGQPKHVIRDRCGEILGYEGVEMNTEEEFTCENCDNTFVVNVSMTPTAHKLEEVEQEINAPVKLF